MKTNRLRLFAVMGAAGAWLMAGNASANLVGNWRFDGNLNDSSGFSHTGTFGGTAGQSYVTGSGHTALALDGVDQFMSVAASGNDLDLNAESFTIAAWLTVHSVPTARREAFVVGKANSTSVNDYGMTVDYNNQTTTAGALVASAYTGPGGGAGSVASTISYDSYVNLVMTYYQPTGTLTLYRNGALRDTRSGLTGPFANAAALEMGRFNDGGGLKYLKADLDEIQIYDQFVTQPDVVALFNGGNGPVAVPEPTTVALLALGGLLLLRRRKS